MKKYFLHIALYFVTTFFSASAANAQKNTPADSALYPDYILKVSYQDQLKEKVTAIETKKSLANKLPGTTISPLVLKNSTNATDFLAAYNTKNVIVGPMFLPSPYRTYLRIGEYRSGIPIVQDQVVSTFFNETEQSCLMTDKEFTNRTVINSSLTKDVIAAWEIETAGSAGFKISTTGTKKYLSVSRTGGAGSERINLTTDRNDLTTNWIIYSGTDDGITFYNPTYNIFLGRRVQERKIYLVPFSYKEYGNEALRKVIIISWDIYNQSAAPYERGVCFENQYWHSMRYMLARPQKDTDKDGHNNLLCGGDDCDDNDAAKYPGNTEVCDADGHDEDCIPHTYGLRDADGDGYYDYKCFNVVNGVIKSSGTDCDDNNAAIYPGQQIFVNETTVDVCGKGVFELAAGFMAVKQPNGTAIVIPKK
jgi:Putative metal-binding motif